MPKIIERLGFATYPEYLASPLWKGIRAKVLARDKHSCVRCHEKAVQVHHLQYSMDTLRGDCLDFLASLCRACHEHGEFDGGRKVKLLEANKRLGLLNLNNLPWMVQKKPTKAQRRRARNLAKAAKEERRQEPPRYCFVMVPDAVVDIRERTRARIAANKAARATTTFNGRLPRFKSLGM